MSVASYSDTFARVRSVMPNESPINLDQHAHLVARAATNGRFLIDELMARVSDVKRPRRLSPDSREPTGAGREGS